MPPLLPRRPRYGALQLIPYLFVPPPAEMLSYMRQKGRDDARAWAKQQGFSSS